MSAILDCALQLAQQKVRFFPVRPNSKLPAVTDFSTKATSNPEQLTEYFGATDFNSGIACGKVAEGLYLVGFDIDNKKGGNGYETVELMAELGEEFPLTWAQKTPSGGEHRLFWSPVPIKQGTNVAGAGVDFRGDGGYLVGPGSKIGGVYYNVLHNLPIAKFPQWAIDRWEKKATLHSLPVKGAGKPVENQVYALQQSVAYLSSAPTVYEGGRSDACFKVCAQLRDYGLDQSQIFDVLLTHWRCEPMLSDAELMFTIGNAFKYTKGQQGKLAPERLFTPVITSDVESPLDKNPIDLMNENHFFYAANGVTRVCWETKRDGKYHLERFPVYAFHEKYAAKKMLHNGKQVSVTKMWMESEHRREYDCLRFDPDKRLSPNEYNTWRGFAVDAAPADVDLSAISEAGRKSVELFIEHCRENICAGDEKLTKWLLTYIAHMFQRPGEKPGVSLVFQGKKGTGKTIVSEILEHLIGDNAILLADKTHVLGHFNSLMEDKILVTLDEAFWSGDKEIEGVLKDVITGSKRVITRKGAESYTARVFDRVIIIGNERWLVPATSDERRFAVFKVGDGRRKDRKFFGALKDGIIKHGGGPLLMKFFMDWDLEQADIFDPPATEGLDDQKRLSLGVFEQWWFSCLEDGKIVGSGLDGWPEHIPVHDIFDSFRLQTQRDGYRGYPPTRIQVGKMFNIVAPASSRSKNTTGNVRKYAIAPLDIARAEWEHSQGMKHDWGE